MARVKKPPLVEIQEPSDSPTIAPSLDWRGPGHPFNDAPKNPEKVMMIANLRDYNNLRWRQMGDQLGISYQSMFQLYKRWQEWIQKQREEQN